MARRRSRSRGRRKGGRRSKAFYARIGRKGGRAAARKRSRRRASRRSPSRRRRRRSGRVYRPVLRRRRRRWYAAPGSKVKGRRINPRRRRRRSNPGFAGGLRNLFPTRIADFKNAAVLGAGGAAGFLGVSALNNVMDRLGVGNLKARIANPLLFSIACAAQSIVSTFVLGGVCRMVLKGQPEFCKGVFAGGATKAILDVATPLLSQVAGNGGAAGEVAEAALSGYQEQLAGFQEVSMSGFREVDPGLGYVSSMLNQVALANEVE